MTWISRLLEATAIAALCGSTGIVVGELVDGRWPMVVSFGAATGAVAAGLALSLIDRSTIARPKVLIDAGLVVGGGIAAAVVVTLATRSNSSTGGTGVGATIDALIHGWAAIATSGVPAPAEPRLLVPIAVASWGAASASMVLSRRRTGTVGPLLPPVVLLLLASLAAGSHPSAPVAVGATFVGLGSWVVLLRTGSATGLEGSDPVDGGKAATRWVGAGLITFTVAVAATAGPPLSLGQDEDPFDPRQVLVPALIETDAANPLDFLASARLDPDEVLFEVRSDGPVPVRLVSLEAFDGIRWTTRATYEPVGPATLDSDRLADPTGPTRVEFRIERLDGPWLPSVDETRAIVGVEALIDPASRSFVTPTDASGVDYVIEADVPEPELEILAAGLPTADDVAARAAAGLPPGLPAGLRTMAEQATVGATSPFDEAVLLTDLLGRRLTVDPERPGGHSYGHLSRALTESRVVNEEQLATAFALLARSIGLPTRVTVGVAPDAIEPSGLREVRSSDLSVWPEVRFDDVGWVAFRIEVPDDGGAPPSVLVGLGATEDVVVTDGPRPAPASGVGSTGSSPLDAAAAGDPTSADLETARSRDIDWPVWVAVAATATLALLLVAAALTSVLKRRRTRLRRSVADPRARVVGAWHDVLDRLVEVGDIETRQLTVEQIVEADRANLTLAALYRPLNRALYDHRPIEPSDAEVVWQARDRFVDTIGKNATVRCRLRRAVDPRPLWPVATHTGTARKVPTQ